MKQNYKALLSSNREMCLICALLELLCTQTFEIKFQIKTVFSFKFVTESSRHRRLSVTVAACSLVMLIFAPPFLSGRSLPVAKPATESRSVPALGKTGSPSHFPSVWPWMIHTVLLVCLGWQQSVGREESAVCQVKMRVSECVLKEE